MIDLFELPHFSGSEKCGNRGKSSQQDHVPQFSPPSPPVGGGGRGVLGTRGVGRGSWRETRGERAEPLGFWERRRRLQADLAECLTKLAAVEPGAERAKQAHSLARENLLLLTTQPGHDYATVLRPAYEHWRITSFKYHPLKTELQQLHDWHESILEELQEINRNIDDPKPRFSKARTAEIRGEALL